MKHILFWIGCFFFFTPLVHANIQTDVPYSYSQLANDVHRFQKQFNESVVVQSIGKSTFGRDLWAFRLGKGKDVILIVGAHHGREWLSTMVMMKMLEEYAQAYQQSTAIGPYPSSLLNEVSIWFVPMINPDGVLIQQKGLHTVPKRWRNAVWMMNDYSNNFQRWKANGIGIDLNRQYDAGWKEIDTGVHSPYYQFYKGQRPFEAREVKALVRSIQRWKPLIAISYHTSGREIFWFYNNGRFTQRDHQLAIKVFRLTRYPLSTPDPHAMGAGMTDWFIQTYHRPAMTIELSPYVGETNPPLTIFPEEYERNRLVGMMLVAEARRLFLPNKEQNNEQK
jgi:g-D-glutamyl-meso-diaminopimelate peptidase